MFNKTKNKTKTETETEKFKMFSLLNKTAARWLDNRWVVRIVFRQTIWTTVLTCRQEKILILLVLAAYIYFWLNLDLIGWCKDVSPSPSLGRMIYAQSLIRENCFHIHLLKRWSFSVLTLNVKLLKQFGCRSWSSIKTRNCLRAWVYGRNWAPGLFIQSVSFPDHQILMLCRLHLINMHKEAFDVQASGFCA